MDNGNTIGMNVRRIRHALNLKQKEFARRAEIPPSVVCDIEKGDRVPSSEMLIKIAAAFSADGVITINAGQLIDPYFRIKGVPPKFWERW